MAKEENNSTKSSNDSSSDEGKSKETTKLEIQYLKNSKDRKPKNKKLLND